MAEIGSLGAQDFRMTFPQQQGFAQQPLAQQQPVDVQVPQFSNDPLAVREKLTSDYYSNMGMLRSFATDMAKKGIDPFQPDYSQEGGGLAFQTMKKLEANLLYAANALGNEFKAEEQIRPMIARGETRMTQNFDPTQGNAFSNPNNFVPTKLLPGTEELNRRLGQETNDPNSSARINALIRPYLDDLDNQVQQGLLSPEKAEIEKNSIIKNAWKTQVFAPRIDGGIKQQDLQGRAELIKQLKSGILTNNPTSLNILKLSPSVADARYVNTGDQVGIEIWQKGQFEPVFIDLSKGGGQEELNAYLNRIEGQKNVPNEFVSSFDTKVTIPESNAGVILEDVKAKVKAFDEEYVSKLQELAVSRKLQTSDGDLITSVKVDGPNLGIFGSTELKVSYHPVENDKINYSKTKHLDLKGADIEGLIQANANNIAPAFGNVFMTGESTGLKDLGSSEQLSTRQQQALAAFVKQLKREPSASERANLLAKYK